MQVGCTFGLGPEYPLEDGGKGVCWALSSNQVREREDKNSFRLYLNGKELSKLDSFYSLGLGLDEPFILYLQH